MFERFSDRARKVMALANQEALRFNSGYIETEHVLLGLLKEGGGVAATVLINHDIEVKRLRVEILKVVPSNPDGLAAGHLPQAPRVQNALAFAVEEAQRQNRVAVDTGYILLGLLEQTEGIAAEVLVNLGLKLDDLRDEVRKLHGEEIDRDLRRLHRSLI